MILIQTVLWCCYGVVPVLKVSYQYTWYFLFCAFWVWIYGNYIRELRIKKWRCEWPFQYQCSVLPTELTMQLGADHFVVSNNHKQFCFWVTVWCVPGTMFPQVTDRLYIFYVVKQVPGMVPFALCLFSRNYIKVSWCRV